MLPRLARFRGSRVPRASTLSRHIHEARDPRFAFSVAEAYCPKKLFAQNNRLPVVPRSLESDLSMGFASAQTGEDAYFARKWTLDGPLHGSMALGVTDGVGGWRSKGVDPSKLSHALCEEMASEFAHQELVVSSYDPLSPSYHDDRTTTTRPLALLDVAFSKLEAQEDEYAGGTTVCIGVASAFTGMLSIANLGDSGYFIFRQGRVYKKSPAQVHQFSIPYQVSIIAAAMKKANSRLICDKPQDANLYQNQLQHGDVVIFATDGLTDNVFAQEILNIVTSGMIDSASWYKDKDDKIKCSPRMTGASDIAKRLIRHGITSALDPNRESPFSLSMTQEMAFSFPGGKADDITVLVMLVEELSKAQGAHEHPEPPVSEPKPSNEHKSV